MRRFTGKYFYDVLLQIIQIAWEETKCVFRDSGVRLILIIAGIGYPLLYGTVYLGENVTEIPVGVIDECGTAQSRAYAQKLDATREISLTGLVNMEEGIDLMRDRKIHAIIVIPQDFSANRYNPTAQTVVSVYVNMATMFIDKNVGLAANYVMLDETKEINKEMLLAGGATLQEAVSGAEPIKTDMIATFNPGSGFASFFVPGVLILIIHQLLFLGIGMLAGTRRERHETGKLLERNGLAHKMVYREILGRGAAYYVIYSIISAYILIIVPRIFGLPHYNSPWEIYRFMVPFLFAVIFFSQTWSIFIKNRETGMVLFLFMSVILMLLSGLTWPWSNFPTFWKYFSYIFPATAGVQGFVKMNCMGADIAQVAREFFTLWTQAIFYFVTACFSYRYVNR